MRGTVRRRKAGPAESVRPDGPGGWPGTATHSLLGKRKVWDEHLLAAGLLTVML